MSDNFSLILRFDSDDHEFCRGVEIGRLWEMMKNSSGFEQTVHCNNIEMIMRIKEVTEREMKIEDIDDNWCNLIVEEEAVLV